MSRPAFRCRPSSLAGVPESPGTTGQDGRRTSPDASVTDHGHIRGRSRTEQGRPHGPRFEFPGRRLIYYVMLAGLTFPVFLAIVPLFFQLQNFGLLNTRPGLILTYVAFALPFTMFFLYSFFRSLPHDVYEAALIDGAGDWRAFFQVMLPMARPGMAAVAIFNFLGLWNQFLLPVALNTDQDMWVLTQGMAAYASSQVYDIDYGALFAAIVITVVPVLIVYCVFQRRIAGSVSQGTFR
ncbi:carbohydrate ABC transporter permease [Streptomyces albogriseolus]|uniref:carbohydrate ABC transporter permease n=1 Tax=Streptomyces albogriseolus TaxID=1887 RepID=UPI003F4D4578